MAAAGEAYFLSVSAAKRSLPLSSCWMALGWALEMRDAPCSEVVAMATGCADNREAPPPHQTASFTKPIVVVMVVVVVAVVQPVGWNSNVRSGVGGCV